MAKKATNKTTEEAKEVKMTAVEETNAAKTVKATEKKPVKKETKTAEKKDEVYVQFAGEEFAVQDAMEKAKAAYVAEGHRACTIKSVRLYIKPEERKAYYVINEKSAGSIEL